MQFEPRGLLLFLGISRTIADKRKPQAALTDTAWGLTMILIEGPSVPYLLFRHHEHVSSLHIAAAGFTCFRMSLGKRKEHYESRTTPVVRALALWANAEGRSNCGPHPQASQVSHGPAAHRPATTSRLGQKCHSISVLTAHYYWLMLPQLLRP